MLEILARIPHLKEMILPAFSLMAALFGLSTDPKNKLRAFATAGVLVLISILSAVISSKETTDHDAEVTWLKGQLSTIETNQKAGFESVLVLLGSLKSYGVRDPASATLADLGRINSANDSLIKIAAHESLEQVGARPSQANAAVQSDGGLLQVAPERIGTIVRYYKKDVDPLTLMRALESQGFTVQVGEPRNELPTNALWFGDSVPLKDLRIATYTLLRANVALHAVKRFHVPTGSGPKSHLIQVGHDPQAEKKPLLSKEAIDAIQSVEQVPRDGSTEQ